MLSFDKNKIFNPGNLTFTEQAVGLFHFQYENNPLYRNYVNTRNLDVNKIETITEIPFLPIGFFKNHLVQTTSYSPEIIFTSSGTTGSNTSQHTVKDLSLYEESFTRCFEQFYGPAGNYCILGLLPSYLEREGSSLVYMVNRLIESSAHPLSDFYLYNEDQLYLVLLELEKDGQPTILFGVTFALLDLAAKYKMNLHHVTIIETGGMKGRGREYTRSEVAGFLQQQLGVETVHSEYGMTELLSQAYTNGGAFFRCPNWMRVLVRAEDDPLLVKESGRGVLNIIDLANSWSCAFIATDDLGTVQTNHQFEVLGRLDQSDLRGCSLLLL
jgi:phenylacetate-coenzyme A ligase PaaK-like adenylate-forming protein